MTVYAGETVGFKAALEDDTDTKPQCPLPTQVTLQVKKSDEATVLLVETAMRLQVLDQGSNAGAGTGGSPTTIADTGQAWDPDEWRDACVRITAGTGIGQERRIKSNTATVLTIDTKQVVNGFPVGAFSVAPDATSVYQLHRSIYKLNWDSPTNLAGQVVVGIVRSRQDPPNGYLSVEKVRVELEEPAI